MSPFMSLLKTQLNINFGISALKYRFAVEKKKRFETVLMAISIIIGGGILLAFYSYFLFGVYTIGAQLNQPEIVLVVAILASQIFILIFGMFYLMSAFYFAKDVSILVPLPLKPYEVLGSKFAVVMVNEYLTMLPIIVPAFVIYGIGKGAGLLYWLKSIIIIPFIPIIPLTISALFIIILMRFVNFRKSRDLLTVIGGFLGMIIGIGISVLVQNIPEGKEEEFLIGIIMNRYGMMTYIGKRFPPSVWAARGISGHGIESFKYIVLFIAVSLALSVVLLWLSNRIFYKSLLAGQEVTRKRKTISYDVLSKKYVKSSSPVVSIFMREWKLILRTPVYLLNCLTGIIIGPILLIIFLFTKNMPIGEYASMFLEDPDKVIYVQLVSLAFILYVSGLNTAASTAVSREGQTFWVSKMIPVSAEHQVMAKFFHSYSIACLGALLMAIIFAVSIMPLLTVLPVLILGIIGSVPLTAVNLVFDVMRPKLLWHNPQEAVKQNTNTFFGILASLLILALLFVATIYMFSLGFKNWIVFLVLALIMAVFGIITLAITIAVARKSYERIEI